ncbi:hypothetical protein AAVH_28531 [Aphelenchoides avenae]|nr:hypothetical protein AAVH_28531 [Aphelenchus avenae]
MPLKKYLEDDYGNFTTARAVRLHLIEEVRKQPRIFTNNRLSAAMREKYFAPIARTLGYRRDKFEDVHGAWKSLRESFQREQRKLQRGQVTEANITWTYFQQMKWMADVSNDGEQVPGEEVQEDDEEQEEPMVLDGGQEAAVAHADANNVADNADNAHDNADNTDEVVDVGTNDAVEHPPMLPGVEYVIEQPAYLERLPELMDAVEKQLEAASSWQALFGQTIGMRLKDLPAHKQGRVVDAVNKIFNDAEEEVAAEAARELPPSTGQPHAEHVHDRSDDMGDNHLVVDENYDPDMHVKE